MPLFLFHGDNILAIDGAVRSMRERFNAADILTYDGLMVPLADLTEASLTVGLFDPERLVVVVGLHARLKSTKKAESERDDLRTILGAVAPSTTLLLVEKEMPTDHLLLFDVRAAGGEIKAFAMPRKADVPRWIVARAQALGASIDAGAADMLAEAIGANSVFLDTELQKLSTFAGEGRTITPAMVDALVGAITQESIFTLVDAIATGDRAGALQLLHGQIERGTGTSTDFALYIIRMLARQMRILLRIRLGQEAGRSQKQLIDDLKLPRYFADRYFRQAKRLSRERVSGTFDRLAALEHALKSGRADAETGMDILVTEMCG